MLTFIVASLFPPVEINDQFLFSSPEPKAHEVRL